ncbi:hypothetical protein ID866_11024 [Astraeus odoratus]|nr:hypothetical protein ID866_11024 [Astraeus odoratus]
MTPPLHGGVGGLVAIADIKTEGVPGGALEDEPEDVLENGAGAEDGTETEG